MTDPIETRSAAPVSRLRRFAMFPVTRIAIGAALLVVAMISAQALRELLSGVVAPGGPIARSLTGALLVVPVVIAAYVLLVKVVERRPVTELARRGLAAELGLGWLVGGALFAATAGALFALGVFRVVGIGEWTAIVAGLFGSLGPAVFEELLFRGVLFRVVEEALGSWIALAATALVFGLLHLVNPDATLQGALAIVLEAGVLLGAGFMLTRRLWLVIGIHAAWNWVQGGIFGVSVSGTGASGLLRSRLEGPEILTGGAFGAEGSIVAVGVCLIAAVALLLLARRRGHFRPPFWSRPAPPGSGPG